MKDIEFNALCYLEKSFLDKDGGKHVCFEFCAKDSVKIAKLELMGRDLTSYLPVRLKMKVSIDGKTKPKKAQKIRKSKSERKAGPYVG